MSFTIVVITLPKVIAWPVFGMTSGKILLITILAKPLKHWHMWGISQVGAHGESMGRL